ncbi:MAG: hypothetical protein K2H19_01455 [Ruminococcus sp.]|nr:hypothetical protein [Ruminococcus sp.]
MFNKDLRAYAKEKSIFFWQVAKFMGIFEATITRHLRYELTEQEKQKFIRIIDGLSVKNTND